MFVIQDYRALINHRYELINQLRMRKPELSLALNLTTSSLAALDQLIDPIVDRLIEQKESIQARFDSTLFEEIVAYVGEVVVRSCSGNWTVNETTNYAGSGIVFRSSSGEPGRHRVIDIANEVAVQLLEGNSFVRWFQHEIQEDYLSKSMSQGQNGG